MNKSCKKQGENLYAHVYSYLEYVLLPYIVDMWKELKFFLAFLYAFKLHFL